MPWKDLCKVLTTEGEPLSVAALQEYLSLLMDPSAFRDLEQRTFDAASFAAIVLSFDEASAGEKTLLP